MSEQQILERVVGILKPFVKAPEALERCNLETSILGDLRINSARLVDVVLEIEDQFGLEVTDEQADRVRTVGDAVRLIQSAQG